MRHSDFLRDAIGVGVMGVGLLLMSASVGMTQTPSENPPDLTVTVTKFVQKTEASGDKVMLKLQLSNQGAALAATDRVVIVYWRSGDAVVGSDDQLLHQDTLTGDIFRAGTPVKVKRKLVALPAMAGRFFIVRVEVDGDVNVANNEVAQIVPDRGCRKEVWRSESEPTSAEAPQGAGSVRAGTCVALSGLLSTTDDVDGYRLLMKEALTLDLTLISDDFLADFDLVILDVETGNTVEICESPTSPEVCTIAFEDEMLVAVVVLPTEGLGSYTLTLRPSTDTQTTTFSSQEPSRNTNTLPFQTLAVSTAGSGTGTVTSGPSGIDCGEECSGIYEQGAGVTLAARPAEGSTFVGWSGGGCAGTSPVCQVAMTTNLTVTATFLPQVSLQEPSGSPNTIPLPTLTVITTGSGTGTVTSTPIGIDCGGDCSEVHEQSVRVTLAARPAEGSRFAGWSGGGCAGISPVCQVTMTSDLAVAAAFAP